MRKVVITVLILLFLAVPGYAMEYTAPAAPDSVQDLMPVEQTSFGSDLWTVVKNALDALHPKAAEASGICLRLIAATLLMSLLLAFPGNSGRVVEFAGILVIATLLLGSANSMIRLGAETVKELSEYGKMLLPVLTAALAAQGGAASSAALYAGTAAFDAVLSSLTANVLVPMVYIYLLLSIAATATGQEMLSRISDSIKGAAVWGMKTVLYIFTGYMTLTGVISGATDASALKAAKLTISGMVPTVGGILSDASEAVLVGAGLMKSAVGVYGAITLCAIWISPFFQLGVQYLLLKLTGALCSVFGVKPAVQLIDAFSGAMGMLLGMIGTVCVLLLVSTVCFMRSVG